MPSVSSQVEALREAKFRLGEGQRLYDAGEKEAAREKWKQAAGLFQQADDGLGEADAYLRLADSYQPEVLLDAQARQDAFDFYMAALLKASDVYETLIQKELAFDQDLLRQADTLYRQGLNLFKNGQCGATIPLLDQARALYKEADYGAGEIRASMVKARCLVKSNDLTDYFMAVSLALEGLAIANRLPLGTSTTERYLQGMDLYRRGRFTEALEALNKALDGYRQAGKETGMAQVLHDVGNVYATWGDYARAQDFYQQALPMFVAQDDLENEGAVWNNLGNVALQTGEFAVARGYYAKAIDIWRRLGLLDKEAASLNGLGLAWREMGEYERALASFEWALDIERRLYEAQEEEGDTLNNIGYVHYAQGRLTLALDYFEQALPLYRRLPNRLKEAASLNNIGSVRADLGEYRTALDYFERALAIGEQVGVEPLIVKSLLNMASIHLQQGAPQEAIRELTRSLAYFEEIDEKPTLAMIHSNLGAAYLKLGDTDQAAYHLEQARDVFTAINHFEGEAYATANLGMMALQRGDLEGADSHLRQSLAAWERAGSPIGRARVLGNLGAIAEVQGDYRQALVYQLEALALSEQAGTQADQARLLAMVGTSYLGLGEIALARSYGQDALRLSRALEDPTAEIVARAVLGMADYAAGEPESAYDELLVAIHTLESLQGTITIGELKSSFLAATADAYALAVMLAVETHRPEAAFLHAEQARARALLDQLANHRLGLQARAGLLKQESDLRLEIIALDEQLRRERSKPEAERQEETAEHLNRQLTASRQAYTRLLLDLQVQNPGYAALVTGRVLTLPEVQALLEDDTTLLEYFVTENQTLVFIVTRDAFEVIPLDVGREVLEDRTRHLRALLESKSSWDLPSKREALAWFYRSLIAPALPHITGSQLGIIPHDVLHYVPFAALTDGEHPLIEHFTLFYLPAASVLPYLSPHSTTTEEPALVLAHPGVSGLPRLIYATREAHTVASLYDTAPWIESEATEAVIKAEAGDYSVVHIAAHGELVASSPLFSALWLASDEREDGRLEVQEIYDLDLTQTSLVVLSACQTQIGPVSRGDELDSLQRAFIYAGSPSVVASLWSVDDEATWELMVRFHRHLRDGLSKAEALRLAQLKVREQYSDPYFWAAFTLAGDPGGLFAPESAFRVDWIILSLFFLCSGWLFLKARDRDQAG